MKKEGRKQETRRQQKITAEEKYGAQDIECDCGRSFAYWLFYIS